MSVVSPWALQSLSYPLGIWPTCSELSLTKLSIFSSTTCSFGTAHTLLNYFISDTLVRFVPNSDGSFDILPPLLSTAFTSTLVPHPHQRDDGLLSVPQPALIWAYGIKWSAKTASMLAVPVEKILLWYAVCSLLSKCQLLCIAFGSPGRSAFRTSEGLLQSLISNLLCQSLASTPNPSLPLPLGTSPSWCKHNAFLYIACCCLTDVASKV